MRSLSIRLAVSRSARTSDLRMIVSDPTWLTLVRTPVRLGMLAVPDGSECLVA
jgi:hypothetical protein